MDPLTEFQPPPQDPPSSPDRFRTPDFKPPVTPEPPALAQHPSLPSLDPPRPPRLRIRRRQPAINHGFRCDIPSFDQPVPSIELSESSNVPARVHPSLPHTPNERLLSPSLSTPGHAISPPRTPAQQMTTSFDDMPLQSTGWTGPSPFALGIRRPNSAWSDFSDASTGSSQSSFDSMPSFGDSCTSPGSEADPFTFPETRCKAAAEGPGPRPALGSPMQIDRFLQKSKSTVARYDWTTEMDQHIWLTYIKYLQDPRVTPFKTLPGSAPPLGVCHRVAREARKTWKNFKLQLSPTPEARPMGDFASIDETLAQHAHARSAQGASADSPNTIRPEPRSRPLSTDPSRKKWTATSRQTRHRLRALCKRRPQLSPHYQRLMQSRSPSPMESSLGGASASRSPPISSSRRPENAFSTRDMNFTLATSTAASMQPSGPLAQLSGDLSHVAPADSDDDPSMVRSNPHQKSQSLQLELGLGPASHLPMNRLASPFHERRLEPRSNEGDNGVASSSHLEIHHPRPMSGSMKRRAQYQLGEEHFSDDPEVRRDRLEDMFRDPSGGVRRVRMRGFSMGAVVQQQRQSDYGSLSEIFTPPSTDHEPDAPSEAGSSRPALLPPPPTAAVGAANMKRLGSPFVPTGPSAAFASNTFPRSLFPQGLSHFPHLDARPTRREGAGPFSPATPMANEDSTPSSD